MYQRILAPIDGSETAQRAFAIALATARENDAELIPLYVVDVPVTAYEAPGFDPGILRDAYLEEGERLKADALAAMKRESVRGEPRVVESGSPGMDIAECLLAQAQKANADLVVMGTHGRRGVKRIVLGSVAERFVRMARCPVLLVPGGVEPPAAPSRTEKETS